MEEHQIQYRFRFGEGREESFVLHLDADARMEASAEELPEWTQLEFEKCDNCPLQTSHCPLAVRLVEPVDRFADVISYHEVEVEARSPERTITQKTTAQNGISAMLGLVIATSGCPHTAYFRPMARFHLPFASEEETIYRAASMYLLGQYFRHQRGKAADLTLDGLLNIYREVEAVNRAMARRLRAASRQDGAVNALILLDMFAKTLPLAVEESLEELQPLYTAYMD